MAHVIRDSDTTFKVKGQGHQPALLIAVLARQAAAAVGVETRWPWETAATLPSARRRKALRRPRGEERRGISWWPPAYSLFKTALLATTSSETDRSDNERKIVAFGRKNTGISQINGLDDLCQARPQSQGLCLKAKDWHHWPMICIIFLPEVFWYAQMRQISILGLPGPPGPLELRSPPSFILLLYLHNITLTTSTM